MVGVGIEETSLSLGQHGGGAGINDSKQVVNDLGLNPSTHVHVRIPQQDESPSTITNSSKTSLLRDNAMNNGQVDTSDNPPSVEDILKRQQRQDNLLNNIGSSLSSGAAATFEAEPYESRERASSNIGNHETSSLSTDGAVTGEHAVLENGQTIYCNTASQESSDIQEFDRLGNSVCTPFSETVSNDKNSSQLALGTSWPLPNASYSAGLNDLSGTEVQSLSSTSQLSTGFAYPCVPSSEGSLGDGTLLVGTIQQTKLPLLGEEVLKSVQQLNDRENEVTFSQTVNVARQVAQSEEPNNINSVDRQTSTSNE